MIDASSCICALEEGFMFLLVSGHFVEPRFVLFLHQGFLIKPFKCGSGVFCGQYKVLSYVKAQELYSNVFTC